MNNWRFAFSRRWFTYLAMAIVFAIACVLLSQWQLGRRNEAVAAIDRVDRNYGRQAEPLTGVLPSTGSFRIGQEWLPVTMTGTYLVKDQLLVRNRPYGGRPGFEVLTPLALDNGSVFVVDRGWVPTGVRQDSPDSIPSPPDGVVTVVARLRQGEPTLPARSAPPGQLATIHLPAVQRLVGSPTYTGAYGLLASENPAPAENLAPAVKPELDEGPHLSYAFQWLLFAIMGFAGLGWAIRQEYRIRNADDPEERKRAESRDRKRRAKSPTDDQIEDAILDAR